jgi:predicted MFS family arabinose efflux permease
MLKALGFIKLAKKEDKEGLPTLSKVLLGAAVGSTIGSPAGRLIAKATKWDPVGKG